jgi:hypothetical protein
MKRALAILLLMAAPALAQTPPGCGRDEAYKICINRLLGGQTAAEAAARAAEIANAAAAAVTAERIAAKVIPETVPGAAGSIRDFLPLFFGTLGLGGVKDEAGALTLTFNPELLSLGPANPLSLQAEIKDPVPFDALLQAIPEVVRAGRKSAFEKELKDFDDVALDLAWSRESERLGRNYRDHRQLLSGVFLALTEQTLGTVPAKASKVLLDDFVKQPDGPAPAAFSVDMTPAQVDGLDPAYRARLDQHIAEAGQEVMARQKALVELAAQQRFFELDDLINNQPQVLASATYRRRADLVGPDDLAAKFSYEIGFANVNGLRRHCGGRESEVDGDCLKSYLDKFGSTLESSPRLAITAEYSQSDAYDFALPADALSPTPFAFHLDRISKGVGKLVYGRYLRADASGVQTTRIDVEASYEIASGDPARNDRFLATATFTQKLAGDMSASLTAVYSNRPEFRGEVDKELSARFGLKYKLDRPPAEK